MPKVYLICGKICSGKSTYAEQLRVQNHAVLLSIDEITLALFGQYCGYKHDDYVERTQNYLFNKSLELIAIAHRHNDIEDKLVGAPIGMSFTKDEIENAIHFQEQYYDTEIEAL